MKTEIQNRADFSSVRYGQCWEDADILVEALKVHEGRRCLSIGSAGDNSFALLAAGASHVTAVEMNPAQIACIELRKKAYLELDYPEFLKTVTSSKGKFENYFELFRTRLLPLAHTRKRIDRLLESRSKEEREKFYESVWNNRRWRWIFRAFFSRFMMGRLGRDPAFFDYVEGSVADRILERTRFALTQLDPSRNPYLHWILRGCYGEHLPLALREDSYLKIRTALEEDRFEIVHAPIEAALTGQRYDAFNLSDIFEYMSPESTDLLIDQIVDHSNPDARLAYWNMLAQRESKSPRIQSLPETSEELFKKDKAFFYSLFIVEEVMASTIQT
jgi:S-adenosylmethionine-diacylglycerol 3-amino-3-carboxypropyl transferase